MKISHTDSNKRNDKVATKASMKAEQQDRMPEEGKSNDKNNATESMNTSAFRMNECICNTLNLH